jgi:hypothetical protein
MHGTYLNSVVSGQCITFPRGRTALIRQRERGVFAIMTALLILVILGFCGLAIDLGRVINRKVELQSATESIALLAARELNGTGAGVTRAANFVVQFAPTINYNYNNSNIEWSGDAIRFGASPYGDTWLDATEAAKPENARNLFYVRVDTSALSDAHGEVPLSLLRVLPSIGSAAQVASTATAGRSSINVLPLALCAMSDKPGEARGTELVEYGFRRGITYDLMQLNPKENTKGANYLINPIALPGTTGESVIAKLDMVRPFICTGKLAIPSLEGGDITVEADFPLNSVYEQLNSRFGSYVSPCVAATAPPDTNIKQFTYSTDIAWMKDKPAQQSAETATKTTATATQLATLADLEHADVLPTKTPDKLGPLWVYAKPAKFISYTEGAAEPANGYATFNATDAEWATLYKPAPKINPDKPYPSPSPYGYSPTSASTNKRRILNVPLLQCPVSTGSPAKAKVLAVAKFFMTVQAQEKQLYGEFAGVLPLTSLVGEVELYP